MTASEDLYRGGAPFAVRSDRLHHPDDPTEEFDRVVVEHPGASVVLAVDAEERVLVVRQYRHPAGHRLVELPAGLLDQPGEDPEEAARRELVEEAGYEAVSWTLLASTYSSPGVTSEVIHLYLARDLQVADRGDFEAAHEEADMELPVDAVRRPARRRALRPHVERTDGQRGAAGAHPRARRRPRLGLGSVG